ncbi:Beta-galactosidase [Posidoniimonas polymericola]|uniref:Beta-galactosidase n=1 Tax=Posidoniimonas polymericola TaxID=2528002 RepID=A0A5C5YPM2_9BACT|nr:sugar-binding domain-containing protein [Posidoniimonas polymericola]TWT76823.1 Beta-galactosidase [Posidoniimonas polymericola]
MSTLCISIRSAAVQLKAIIVLTLFAACTGPQIAAAADGGMQTRWAKDLDKNNVLPEYPRPQLVRPDWTNLNGEWDLRVTEVGAPQPESFDERILVPFPVEAPLSGATQRIDENQAVWYRRQFEAPELTGGRLLLHFGAVDWDATVWVNGQQVGTHQGGFDAFSFDITQSLRSSGPQTLLVKVLDPTNRGNQPHGKQALEPGSIVYTAVTGIWQTVWLERVPPTYISSLKLTPDVEAGELEIVARVIGPNAHNAVIRARVPQGDQLFYRKTGRADKPFRLKIPNAELWSPESPKLYDLQFELAVDDAADGREVIDSVESYFGMRRVELRMADDGFQRIHLNGKPVFNFGPLDQGWWPDGLYTAPTDEALKYDIAVTKQYGFNMCRKHVKVEPARWYYWCDKLGLLVWQDMPSGDRYIGWNEPDGERTPDSERVFRTELREMMDELHNFASIVVWVPFNEGWGQFKTEEIIGWVKNYDPSRLVDGPSGWADRGVGDLYDKHDYPGPAMFPPEQGRASVLGEFGGLGLAVEGHLWQESGNWGYNFYETREELNTQYQQLIDNLWVLKAGGLAAAIYTQTTDVEGEINGLMTYDREVLKINPELAAPLNTRLYAPAPKLTTIVATSKDPEGHGELWRYTTDAPGSDNWTDPAYDDSSWKSGRAGFGAPNTPGAVVRTEWTTSDIWLRREIELSPAALTGHLYLFGHHDEDADVYCNGQKIATLSGYTEGYRVIVIPSEARELLRPGPATLAIHCRQFTGGQYIDMGLITLGDAPEAANATAANPRSQPK